MTGANGPEAGVWVIAETTDLPTKYAKIVVTNDTGQFVIPQLPSANYKIWVRGYGLVDSDKQDAKPGKNIDLKAKAAPTAAAAAEYYPGMYWYSMLKIPAVERVSELGQESEWHVGPGMTSQAVWIDSLKNSCQSCHAIGSQNIRHPHVKELGQFKNSEDMWERRVQSGQAMNNMALTLGRMGPPRAYKMFADWTDRIAAGELPADKPERPTGVERNIVITSWAWGKKGEYLHDEVSTDKRNPTVNAYGKIYGSPEESSDDVPVLDPIKHTASYHQGAVPRSGHTERGGRTDGAVGVLGRGADLGWSHLDPQPDDGRKGPALAHGANPQGAEPRELQGRIGSSLGAGCTAQRFAAPSLDV